MKVNLPSNISRGILPINTSASDGGVSAWHTDDGGGPPYLRCPVVTSSE